MEGYNSANGGVMSFDGSNDYVNVPINIGATATFSMWTKTVKAASKMLFALGSGTPGPDLYFKNNKIYWNTYDGEANPFCSITSNLIGIWHNFTVVVENGSTKQYYDSVHIGTAIYKNPTKTSMQIGGHSGYFWSGLIDNVSVYNHGGIS